MASNQPDPSAIATAPNARLSIAIIGCGMIGSSLAQAITQAEPGSIIKIYDIDSLHAEQGAGLVPGARICNSAAAAAADADLVFVATPVGQIAPVIRRLVPTLAAHTVITDTGSAKAEIIADVEARFADFRNYVPGHPVAGVEHAGPLYGRPDMFAGKAYVLTPSARTSAAAVQRVESLVARIGGRVRHLAAAEHDRIMAFVSHLPHLYAFSMMNAAVEESARAGVDLFGYAGGAFLDISRITAEDTQMWIDIFRQNKAALRGSYLALKSNIESMLDAIDEDDDLAVERLLNAAKTAKQALNREA